MFYVAVGDFRSHVTNSTRSRQRNDLPYLLTYIKKRESVRMNSVRYYCSDKIIRKLYNSPIVHIIQPALHDLARLLYREHFKPSQTHFERYVICVTKYIF
jgi:hypothetical protein